MDKKKASTARGSYTNAARTVFARDTSGSVGDQHKRCTNCLDFLIFNSQAGCKECALINGTCLHLYYFIFSYPKVFTMTCCSQYADRKNVQERLCSTGGMWSTIVNFLWATCRPRTGLHIFHLQTTCILL